MKQEFEFIIPVRWEVSDEVHIKASSLEEAFEKAREADLPDGEYVDGSFEINADIIDEYEQNRIAQECCKIKDSPRDQLPLIIHDAKSTEAISFLEERLKEEE